MQKYRKRPVVIEAIKYESENGEPLDFVQDAIVDFVNANLEIDPCGSICIPTLEGVMMASVGDYIIKGVKGEFYPCKPDIFEATYDAVEG